MSEAILTLMQPYTGAQTYYLPTFSMSSMQAQSTAALQKFIGAREALVGEADWTTQRLLWNAQWHLQFHALQDELSAGMTTSQLASFLQASQANGTVWVAAGAPLLAVQHEPLLDISPTGSARTVYRSAMPWWDTDLSVWVDEVPVDPSAYLVNANRGVLTFNTGLSLRGDGSPPIVTASVSRCPQIRIMDVVTKPLDHYDPLVYDCACTFHEESPA